MRLKTTLKIDWVQRTLYAIGLLILIAISIKDGLSSLSQQSSLGIEYWYFFIIPSLILLFQIVINNNIGWFSLMLLYLFYFSWNLLSIVEGLNEDMDYFEMNDYLFLFLIIIVMLLFGYFLFLIKPYKKKRTAN